MRCGILAVLSCLAILCAGCGTDATNRGAANTGSRTANKPVIEDKTNAAPINTTPVPGATTDHNIPGAQPGTTPSTSGTIPPTPTPDSPARTGAGSIPSEPDRQTPPATTP